MEDGPFKVTATDTPHGQLPRGDLNPQYRSCREADRHDALNSLGDRGEIFLRLSGASSRSMDVWSTRADGIGRLVIPLSHVEARSHLLTPGFLMSRFLPSIRGPDGTLRLPRQ